MGDSSKIEWTDATWNVALGCTRVSKGCEHCYAEGTALRNERMRVAGYEPGLVRLSSKGKPQWTGEVRFLPARLELPLKWTRPRRIFVNSMSDLFHASLSFEQIAAVFGVMAAGAQHTFQVLTKRPERAIAFFAWIAAHDGVLVGELARMCKRYAMDQGAPLADLKLRPWPLPNVWLGVSVEDQKTAEERIPLLLECPAAIRWVSYEPALGPVNFGGRATGGCSALPVYREASTVAVHDLPSGRLIATREGKPYARHGGVGPWVDWIVVGGESGPGARPFDLAWARATVDACRAAGVRCFVKQFGAAPIVSDLTHVQGAATLLPDSSGYAIELRNKKGGDWDEWPADLRVREYPEVRGA